MSLVLTQEEPERDLAHEADMEKLRREQLRADISPEEAREEMESRDRIAELEDRAAWREGADLDGGDSVYDWDDDDDMVCERCHGDGMDPWNDYLLPCPECQSEQTVPPQGGIPDLPPGGGTP